MLRTWARGSTTCTRRLSLRFRCGMQSIPVSCLVHVVHPEHFHSPMLQSFVPSPFTYLVAGGQDHDNCRCHQLPLQGRAARVGVITLQYHVACKRRLQHHSASLMPCALELDVLNKLCSHDTNITHAWVHEYYQSGAIISQVFYCFLSQTPAPMFRPLLLRAAPSAFGSIPTVALRPALGTRSYPLYATWSRCAAFDSPSASEISTFLDLCIWCACTSSDDE